MRREPTLFDTEPDCSIDPRSLYRRDQAGGSAQAAHAAIKSGLADGHEYMIVDALRSHPEITAKQIGELCGLTNVQVLRRTRAMEERGTIESTRNVPGWKGELRFALAGHEWSRP